MERLFVLEGRVEVGPDEATVTAAAGDFVTVWADQPHSYRAVDGAAAGILVSTREAIARRQLKLVGLEKFTSAYPHHLSGGMQQRVAIARALAYNPSVLLMDEPFAALDALTREEMQKMLAEVWRETRKTVIFVTHSIEEAVQLSRRVCVVTPRPGRIDRVIDIDLPWPRDHAVERSAAFADYVREIQEVFHGFGIL